MAYSTEDLYNKAIAKIEEKKLFFIEDVVNHLPCVKSTFYEHFPNESDLYKSILEALDRQRSGIKVAMRSKWYNSEAPALQIGLYKLIATADERRALNSQTHEFEVPEDMEIKINIKRGSTE